MLPLEQEPRFENQFVVPILDYDSPASRITGFQELFKLGLRAPIPMLVIGHKAFEAYVKNGYKPTDRLEAEIREAFRNIRATNPTRGAYIGRAFYVPGIDNPNGPRTAAIHDEDEFVQTVTEFWDFVIRNRYNLDGSDIAVVLHPFINVMDARLSYGRRAIEEGVVLPWSGGYVVPRQLPGRDGLVEIVATFGSDEAVQSCPSDSYVVDLVEGTIVAKQIAYKDTTYVPVSGTEYRPLTVPKGYRLKQALTDEDLLEIARVCQKVYAKRPMARIEFIVQADGIYVREIAPWQPVDEQSLLKFEDDEEIVGQVVTIATEEDLQKISGMEAVIYFPPEAFRSRTTDLFARVAHMPGMKRLVALSYGYLATSHMTRILSDAGHSVIPVGDQMYEDGSRVRIYKDIDGKPKIEFLNSYEDAIVPLKELKRLYKGEAGLKMARIALMMEHGLPVPDGFAIRSEAIWQWLKEVGLYEKIVGLDTVAIDDQEALRGLTERIQQLILEAELPEAFRAQIQRYLDVYDYPSWIVRSSGSEDVQEQSLAGLYESSVAMKPEDVFDNLKQTVASYFSSGSITILRNSAIPPSKMCVGVGLQELIPETDGVIGAVVFTYQNEIKIEATAGTPHDIVSHTASDFIEITTPRDNGSYTQTRHGQPAFTLHQDQIAEIVRYIKQIEGIFQTFQDVELMLVPGRGVIILQARPRR